MEVRVLLRHPCHEFRHFRMRAQSFGVGEAALQLLVRKGGVDEAVADRMDRNRLAPAAALGHGMMPLNFPPQRPFAEEAAGRLLRESGGRFEGGFP